MLKKALLPVGALLFLLVGGVSLWHATTDGDPEARSDSDGEFSAALFVKRDEYDRLRARLDEARKRLGVLAGENQKLAQEVHALRVAAASPTATEESTRSTTEASSDGDSGTASGLDWSSLSRLVADNLDLMQVFAGGMSGRPPPRGEEQASFMKIMSEILKLSAEARGLTRHPLLDEGLFGELTAAIFHEPLGLTDAQVQDLNDATGASFEELLGDIDPDELAPLARYEIRETLSQRFLQSLESLLSPDQHTVWDGLEAFSRRTFQGSAKWCYYGIEHRDLPGRIADDWKETFSLRDDQLGLLEPLATRYVDEARSILKRYGENNEAILSLSKPERARLERQLLEAQRRAESQIEPLLDEAQLEYLLDSDPRVFRFEFGKSRRQTGVTGMF